MVLTFLGLLVGVFSGLLGVGGGIMLVPALVALKYPPINAVANSALAVLLIVLSGTFFHYDKKNYNLKNLAIMALPCVVTTQVGVLVANYINPALLMILFGFLILAAFLLFVLKASSQGQPAQAAKSSLTSLLIVGSIAGYLSGMFGVGGGVILVPLQVLFLRFGLKNAVRNSLAVVLVASCFSTFGHAILGNIIFKDAFLIGLGGVAGAQIGARLVPKISERIMAQLFMIVLFMLAIYVFWQAFNFSH